MLLEVLDFATSLGIDNPCAILSQGVGQRCSYVNSGSFLSVV
jgi:hypothetical protein